MLPEISRLLTRVGVEHLTHKNQITIWADKRSFLLEEDEVGGVWLYFSSYVGSYEQYYNNWYEPLEVVSSQVIDLETSDLLDEISARLGGGSV